MKNRINRFSPFFAEYDSEGCIDKLIKVFDATPVHKDAYDRLINL
jgi:hypothetical protein